MSPSSSTPISLGQISDDKIASASNTEPKERVRLRDIIVDGPIPLEAPCYNFIFFFIFTLITSSLIFQGIGDQQYLMALTGENFAPKNILLFYYLVITSVSTHSVIFFPYENYDSKTLKILCIYPANFWLSLLAVGSAITIATGISWLIFGSGTLPSGISELDIISISLVSFVAWPLATTFISFLLLPKKYMESNRFLNGKALKYLIRTFLFFFVVSGFLSACIAIQN